MVTNIDLSSPEVAEKRSLSGKPALVFSTLLLIVAFLLLAALLFLKNQYAAQEKDISAQINEQNGQVSGTEFSDILDFQGRLNLADKMIDDHAYWDNLLVKMGGFVVPEARLEKFSGKKDSSGAGTIDISGVAANFDALSRELILLKSFPNLDSLEFKNAGEGQTQAGGQGGVSFEASLKINKAAFQK